MILRLPRTALGLEQDLTIVFNLDPFCPSVVTQFRACVYTFALYSNKSTVQMLVSLGLRLLYAYALILVAIDYVCGSST